MKFVHASAHVTRLQMHSNMYNVRINRSNKNDVSSPQTRKRESAIEIVVTWASSNAEESLLKNCIQLVVVGFEDGLVLVHQSHFSRNRRHVDGFGDLVAGADADEMFDVRSKALDAVELRYDHAV